MPDLTDLSTEYLSQTFENLDLSSDTLKEKEFNDCTFKQCDFSETIFSRCKFIDCHFIDCNLSLAKIDYCRFTDTLFEGCKLVGIDWTRVAWPNIALSAPVKYQNCILNDSSFFGLGLQEVEIKHCKAHDVDFRETDLSEADFTGTDLLHSRFNQTNLTRTDFTDAFHYSIDIYQNSIKGARFSRQEALGLLDSLEIELVD